MQGREVGAGRKSIRSRYFPSSALTCANAHDLSRVLYRRPRAERQAQFERYLSKRRTGAE